MQYNRAQDTAGHFAHPHRCSCSGACMHGDDDDEDEDQHACMARGAGRAVVFLASGIHHMLHTFRLAYPHAHGISRHMTARRFTAHDSTARGSTACTCGARGSTWQVVWRLWVGRGDARARRRRRGRPALLWGRRALADLLWGRRPVAARAGLLLLAAVKATQGGAYGAQWKF